MTGVISWWDAASGRLLEKRARALRRHPWRGAERQRTDLPREQRPRWHDLSLGRREWSPYHDASGRLRWRLGCDPQRRRSRGRQQQARNRIVDLLGHDDWAARGLAPRPRPGGVRRVALSNNGGLVATSSEDGTVKVSDRRGAGTRALRGSAGGVWGVAFGADGACSVAAADCRHRDALGVSERPTASPSMVGHTGVVYGVQVSRDGHLMANWCRRWRRTVMGGLQWSPAGNPLGIIPLTAVLPSSILG